MKPNPPSRDEPAERNRTGMLHHPGILEEMIEGAGEFKPPPAADGKTMGQFRATIAREVGRIGSMPRPEGVPEQRLAILDKLGARMAFERAGVRLYDALISKHEAYGGFGGGPSKDDLAHIRGEELAHEHLARELIVELGGDATAMTPSASLQLTASKGVLDVVADPRVTLIESLEAALEAELVDHESWEALIEVSKKAMPGRQSQKLVTRMGSALTSEAEHLEKVRGWLRAARKL